jgi:hypothetical protein
MGRHKKIIEEDKTDIPEASITEDKNIKESNIELDQPIAPEIEQPKPEKKEVKEKINPAPPKKGKKGKMVSINGDAFSRFSIGIERVSLQFHKDKELKNHEEMLIDSSARQLAELYEVPKMLVLIQYGAAMLLPHAVRFLNAHAEKIELQNEEKKMDIQKKKEEIEKAKEGLDFNKIKEEIV